MRLLLIEDEPDLLDSLAQALREEGYAVDTAEDGLDGLDKALTWDYNAIILDGMLPRLDGWAVLERLRLRKRTPVIMLTARDGSRDRVRGLDHGADDYVVKPFSARELLARIKAVLRRSRETEDDGSIEIGKIRLDASQHKLLINNENVHIGPTEYRLLHFLMSHSNRIYSRNQLLDFVWGGTNEIEDRTVDVHIRRLRKALEPFLLDSHIETVRGTGYRFNNSISNSAQANE